MQLRVTSILLLALALAVCAPAGASIVYSNGPFNGNINTYFVCCGSQTTESFTVSAATTITSFDAAFRRKTGDERRRVGV